MCRKQDKDEHFWQDITMSSMQSLSPGMVKTDILIGFVIVIAIEFMHMCVHLSGLIW